MLACWSAGLGSYSHEIDSLTDLKLSCSTTMRFKFKDGSDISGPLGLILAFGDPMTSSLVPPTGHLSRAQNETQSTSVIFSQILIVQTE